jgi:hypothetical protein
MRDGVGSRFRTTIYQRQAAHPKTTPDPFGPIADPLPRRAADGTRFALFSQRGCIDVGLFRLEYEHWCQELVGEEVFA